MQSKPSYFWQYILSKQRTVSQAERLYPESVKTADQLAKETPVWISAVTMKISGQVESSNFQILSLG